MIRDYFFVPYLLCFCLCCFVLKFFAMIFSCELVGTGDDDDDEDDVDGGWHRAAT